MSSAAAHPQSATCSDAQTDPAPDNKALKYKRVLLKLSGEALMGDLDYGVDPSMLRRVAKEIKSVVDMGVEVGLVIGGGNIFRGVSGASQGMDRTNADHMGMLATVINALAMKDALMRVGVDCRVQSAIPMMSVCEPFIRGRAIRHMEKGRVVLFAAGTGNPFFTTDSAAALRAAEIGCDALLKGTKVDGIYDSVPVKNPGAKRYDTITYRQVLAADLKVMDTSAIALTRDSNIPILVFSLLTAGSMADVVQGRGRYTLVQD